MINFLVVYYIAVGCATHYVYADCYYGDGKTYTGKVDFTVSGRTCQQWDSDYPHKRNKETRDNYNDPGSSLSEARNYCRNPDASGGPWCYTTDPGKRWELCDITQCTGSDCYEGDGKSYAGKVSTSKSGKTCQSWVSQTPHEHFTWNQKQKDPSNYPEDTVEEAANYCRNPDGESMPYCYTMDEETRWEHCDIPQCTGGAGSEGVNTLPAASIFTIYSQGVNYISGLRKKLLEECSPGCVNGGKCVGGKCKCTDEWKGETCAINIVMERYNDDIEELKETINQKNYDIEQLKDTINKNNDVIYQLEETINQNNDDIAQLKDTLSQKNDDVEQPKEAINQNHDEIEWLEEIINENDDEIEQLKETINQNNDEIEQLKETINKNNDDIETINQMQPTITQHVKVGNYEKNVVVFDVGLSASCNNSKTIVKFDTVYSQKNADIAHGVFTVHQQGGYYFTLTATSNSESSTKLPLYIVKRTIEGEAWDQLAKVSGVKNKLSTSIVAFLEPGDQVAVKKKVHGTIFENSNHLTHFTGQRIHLPLFPLLSLVPLPI